MAKIDVFPENLKSSSDHDSIITDKDFAALKSDISSLQDDFKRLLSDVSSIAQEGSKRSVEVGKAKAEKAKKQFAQTRTEAESKIREKPLTSVAIALGVGALIAILAKK